MNKKTVPGLMLLAIRLAAIGSKLKLNMYTVIQAKSTISIDLKTPPR